ncbi:aminoacyl-tRNA hydrolase [Wolbachia endosymbiont of Pentidionis agamae]|uniref:aminoacyl-tRNA hydrolase n=1 Tax=Wolbachia endosymbiont of Pentidionis agamae TaxID=3110435 RepID=UPI002FD046C1
MHLIIGLGNPGSRYDGTYHNVGFSVIDSIHLFWQFLRFSVKKGSLFSFGSIEGNKVMLLKPYSFMNNSGSPTKKILNFYNVPLNNVIVIHDDADLSVGKIKIKRGGSSAGHNGLKSIDSSIGNNYLRIRIGIGRPEAPIDLACYVLSKIQHIHTNEINQSINNITKNINSILCNEDSGFIF